MTKHILVATDGSDTASRAVALAAELAAKLDVPLTVGHVLQFGRLSKELVQMAEVEHLVAAVQRATKIDPDVLRGLGSGSIVAGSGQSADTVRAITLIGEEIVSRAADRARDLGVTKVDTRTVNDDPADGILEMAGEVGADMIVVGHRGLGRVRTLLTGSVAQKVNNHADCTVVAVR